MAPRPKLTDAQVRKIRDRVQKGARQTDVADEFEVNRKTIRRRLEGLERSETEKAEQSGPAADTRLTSSTNNEGAGGPPPTGPVSSSERLAPPTNPPDATQAEIELQVLGEQPTHEPLDAGTRDPFLPTVFVSWAERLAYYESRSLESPSDMLNYHDALRRRETPDEIRAREKGEPLRLRS